MIKPKSLPPFKRLCVTIGNLPSSYVDSLSYYECVMWLCKYLQNTVIPAINGNAEAINQIQEWIETLNLQEYVDEKLDEMVEDGTLTSLLLNYANLIKSFDTVSDMKADTTLISGMIVNTLGYNNIGDKGNSQFYITEEDLVSNNVTIIELDNGLFAKRIYDNSIYVVDTSLLSSSLVEDLLNDGVTILSDDYIKIDNNVILSTNELEIKNMKFEGNGATYVLRVTGSNINIHDCQFKGDCGNYIRLAEGSHNSKITNNTFNCNNGNVTTPVVVQNTQNIIVSDNTFIKSSGFNIQVLFSKLVNISNNTFKNDTDLKGYTAVGGERNVELSAIFNPARKSVRVNGTVDTGASFSYDSENEKIIITLTNALTSGDVVVYRAYKSLECININSNSYDVTVDNNVINGTGDSGIVVGSDYHNQSLNPSSTTETDYPGRITICNNVITNCAYSGIALTHAAKDINISGNTITNTGFLCENSNVFNAGIFVPYTYPMSITNNNISNIISSEHYDSQENGLMYSGITLNPSSAITTNDSYLYFLIAKKIHINNNNIRNVTKSLRLYPYSNRHMQTAIDTDITNAKIKTPECNGITETDGIFTINASASISLDTSDTIDGVNSIKATLGSGSQLLDITNNITKNIKNSMIKISFFAKASDTDKIAQIIYNTAGISWLSGLIQPLTTEWKYYEMSILIGDNIPSDLRIRFKSFSGSQTGTINVCHINYEIQSIND